MGADHHNTTKRTIYQRRLRMDQLVGVRRWQEGLGEGRHRHSNGYSRGPIQLSEEGRVFEMTEEQLQKLLKFLQERKQFHSAVGTVTKDPSFHAGAVTELLGVEEHIYKLLNQ